MKCEYCGTNNPHNLRRCSRCSRLLRMSSDDTSGTIPASASNYYGSTAALPSCDISSSDSSCSGGGDGGGGGGGD